MTTLISFLGKGQADKTTGYKKASYVFPDGSVLDKPYFGLALTEYLNPKRLVLIGTSGSMWDVFFEQQGVADDDLLTTLIDAVAEERVDKTMLASCEKRLADQLGIPVTCLLISYAKETREQISVLSALASVVSENESVTLDVTHGYRHLPMLALVAARYLTHVARVRVKGIYYGALEMGPGGGNKPVLQLDGMLQILDWVEALATYDKDGDYGVFASLLQKDGLQNADLLARAAFHERTSNPVKARESLTGIAHAIDAHEGPMAALFKEELGKRISWYRGNTRDAWELALADAYLARRDYVRAAIFLYEAFVTRATLERKLDINDYRQREEAWQEAKQGNQPARKLEYLRNALTHGVRPDDRDVAAVVTDETRLAEQLKTFRRELFT